MGSCDPLNGLSNKVCVPNQTEDLNLSDFNMMTGINEKKILTEHISCECKCTFDERKCKTRIKSGIMINIGVSANIQKNIMHVRKIIFWILAHVFVKMVSIYHVILTIQWLTANITNINKFHDYYDNKKVRCKIDCYILHTVL